MDQLPLPISPSDFNTLVLPPSLALLPMSMNTDKARVLLTAIALQESGLNHRYQVITGGGKGPARGLLQFERGGGVKGVMTHEATAGHAHNVCAARQCPFDATTIWMRLEHDDMLAVCFARLLLYSDPRALPDLDDEKGAWAYYERTWRPGRPHPEFWEDNHARALAALSE